MDEIARIRGEAMGARHLAQAALKVALVHLPVEQRAMTLESLLQGIDGSLAKSTFRGGDARLNEIVREVARQTVAEDLANVRLVLVPPK